MTVALQHTFPQHLGGSGDTIEACLAGVRSVLDHDPAQAHCLLDRLTALLSASPHPCPDAPLLLDIFEPSGTGAGAGGLAKWQVRRVIAHIDANLTETLTVETLAGLVGLSTGHFSRAFKTSTGETPHSFIIRCRVRRAQMLIFTTDQPLGEVALVCGFTDQAHMTRHFGRLVGATPHAWSRRHSPQ